MEFSNKDFFSKCDQISWKIQIWSLLLKKSLMENLIFRPVAVLNDFTKFTWKELCWSLFLMNFMNFKKTVEIQFESPYGICNFVVFFREKIKPWIFDNINIIVNHIFP